MSGFDEKALQKGFLLGEVRVTPADGELWRGDEQLASLRPKAMDVLIALVVRNGEVVSRDELMEAVWQGGIVSDDTLTGYLSEIRRAIGDDSRNQAVIQTVSKRGYRLTSDVRLLDEEREVSTATRPNRRYLLPAGAAVVALIVALSVSLLFRSAPSVDSEPVVLLATPVNATGDPDVDYFANELALKTRDRLIGRGATVVSGSAADAFAESDADFATLQQVIGAGYVVTSTLERQRDGIRLSAELRRTPDSAPVWSDVFEATPAEMRNLYARIADAMAPTLALPQEGAESTESAVQLDDETYQLFLLGRHHERAVTASSLSAAIDYYQQVLAVEPDYALAYAGIANCEALLIQYGSSPIQEAAPKVEANATKALTLDPTLSHAHHARGLLAFYSGSHSDAAVHFEKAISLGPTHSAHSAMLGRTLLFGGDPASALPHMRRAVQLSPISPLALNNYGQNLTALGRFDDASEQYQKALEVAPEYANTFWGLGYMHWLMQQPENGYRFFDIGLDKGLREQSGALQQLAWIAVDLGRLEEAEQLLARASGMEWLDMTGRHAEFYLHASRGEIDTYLAGSAGTWDGVIYSLRGLAFSLGDDPEQAIDNYESAFETSPWLEANMYLTSAGISHELNLSAAYDAMGRHEEAREIRETLLERLSGYEITPPNVHALLAGTLYLEGDTAAAILHLEQALAAGWGANRTVQYDPVIADLLSTPEASDIAGRLQVADARDPEAGMSAED